MAKRVLCPPDSVRGLDDENEQLTKQLLNMSRRNWCKHRILQLIPYLSGIAALLLALAVL